jgi:hypothetical protein
MLPYNCCHAYTIQARSTTNVVMRREIQIPQMLKTDHQTNLPDKYFTKKILCLSESLSPINKVTVIMIYFTFWSLYIYIYIYIVLLLKIDYCLNRSVKNKLQITKLHFATHKNMIFGPCHASGNSKGSLSPSQARQRGFFPLQKGKKSFQIGSVNPKKNAIFKMEGICEGLLIIGGNQ